MSELRQRQPIVKRRRKLTRAERDHERACQENFKAEVTALDGECIGRRWDNDHDCTGRRRAHHAVKQQWLRTYVSTLDWSENRISEFLWDPANGALVCDGLHDRHHDGTDWTIPREWLPSRVTDFARDWRLMHLLVSEHPPLSGVSDGRASDSG